MEKSSENLFRVEKILKIGDINNGKENVKGRMTKGCLKGLTRQSSD